ncbi:MAG TPA: ATP-binding protein [Bryobacteraceae bacterium]|nr:ATP-binding protein [Bryobacteraceae bacterium]
MTHKARLTIGSVALATLIAGAISAVDLANILRLQFDATLERAKLMTNVASELVRGVLNRQRSVPLAEALQDPELGAALVNILTASRILEIEVVNPAGQILADSDQSRVGWTAPNYPDFETLVRGASWYGKARLLASGQTTYYQLRQELGTPDGQPLLSVRVVVAPALINGDIQKSLSGNAAVALLALLGAVSVAFLASTVAFRKFGQIGLMLDRAASGEFEESAAPHGADELSIVASKVSLLGQRLRGAQSDASDLRGNIDRLLRDLEDAVFVFNRERRLIFASGSLEKFLGKDHAWFSGQALAEVFPPSNPLGLAIEQTARTGRPVHNRRMAMPSPASDGAPAAALLSVDVLERLPGAAGTGSGVLVRLRDPEAQRKIGRELGAAERLAAIGRITGGVAHEVKNPLNAILLHVEVARAKMARGDTDIMPQMDIISREIVRLDRVVKTFLDFTRPVDLRFAALPLGELLNEIALLARPQAESANIKVEVRLEDETLEVRADRDMLKQALLNVVVNAMEAMPQGGELRLEGAQGDDAAEIRISDTGPGIPPELREKIFRLYFTTKKEGSGIGLAMTFRIVQLHDGSIDFTSEPGKGSAFLIRLPVAA